MSAVFSKVLDMSLVGAYCTLFVLLARVLLARVSRKYCYILWAVVFLNLILPFSPAGKFSLIPERVAQPQIGIAETLPGENTYQPHTRQTQPGWPDAQGDGAGIAAPAETNTAGSGNHYLGIYDWLGILWAVGFAGIVLYQGVCVFRFKKRIGCGKQTADRNGVYVCEGINSPFILGILRPRIYLPKSLQDGETEYILAHERCHIRRGDHIIKPAALLIASVHWFNPLVWLAYKLLVNDMEMSCDEKVLNQSGGGIRRQYAGTLLRMAAGQSGFLYTPLAFGEVNVKSRIRHVLSHTKRGVWVATAAAAVLIVVTAGLLFRPVISADNPTAPPSSPAIPTATATPAATPASSAFQTSWDTITAGLGMSAAESEKWQARLREDIPRLDECYAARGCRTDDYDGDGMKDLIVQVQISPDVKDAESIPGAYLCVYMNDDPVYMESYADSLYIGFSQAPVHGDIDNDGYPEIAFSLFTGGCGGAGSSYKDVLKYRDHTLTQMALPGDDIEEFTGNNDVGFTVSVLFGGREDEYKAVCDILGRTVTFNAPNAVDESGEKVRRFVKNEEVGGNCRGYVDFSIVARNGREYLRATEYLTGEAGNVQCVGYATFLIDWVDGTPTVLEFGVEPPPGLEEQ